MKSSFKVFIIGMGICVFILSFLFSSANNIRINGTVQVSQGAGDTLVLSFPLRWDNSWRDQFNWDAAWVFFKYKSGISGWNHVNLCSGGHKFVNGSGQPVPFTSMPGNTGSSTVGLFIYRNTLETGNTPEIICQVKCLKSSLGNLTPQQFNDHEGFILAQAVEMVYIPYGMYALGDGECSNRFAGSLDGSPGWIDYEGLLNTASQKKVYPVTNNVVGSTALTIAANYPKGYKGFYMMKYEIGQEQYVSFLNTLTYAQQQECIPGLAALKRGEYIFGSKGAPSNRNSIIVGEPLYGSNPVIFANNLNNNEVYSEDGDGKTIACNYLSPSDLIAYCSWSGLRPMSELEYEKASRALYPEEPAKGGYAWNTASLNTNLSGVSNGGTRKELAQGGGNANSGSGWKQGPVRCGIFATGSSTQEGAGASFWGVMELSGNLREMCYNVNGNGAFDGTVTGDGTYNVSKWSVTPSYIGVRGGSFAGTDSLLRSSDRTEADYFSALTVNTHDSTVGFRAVRPVGGDVTVTQGNLIARQGGVEITGTACPGVQLDITTDVPAKVMSGGKEVTGMDFTYIWYDGSGNVIPDETGDVLHFNNFIMNGTSATISYQFKRKAICPMGDVTTSVLTLTMPNMALILDLTDMNIDACDNTSTITAKAYCNSPAYTWKYGDKILKTGTTYTPVRSDFGGPGDFTVAVTVSSGSCTSEKQVVQVHIPYVQEVGSASVTMDNCGNVLAIDSRDNKRYCTVKIGTQCWMGKNLDVGAYQAISTSDYWKFDEEGIQKWCYDDSEVNCAAYGGLYEWWEAVCGGKCNSNVTPGNAQSLFFSNESQLATYGAKMVPGSVTQVQGICPEGWHIASDGEWIVLEMHLGMSSTDAYKSNAWRGTDQGTRMKKSDMMSGSWCSSTMCNNSGLGLLPGGYRDYYGNGFSGFYNQGCWWTSTPNNGYAWYRELQGQASVYRYGNFDRSFGLRVRCVKD